MNEPPLHPSRPLKAMAWLARWSLGLLLAVVVLLTASWGALYGWIVPRISDYRVLLEAQAGRALGVPVRIGALTAQRNGLMPAIELRGVALLDPEGRTALHLQRVVLAVSPRSLWRLGFEQLYIERPELDIRRTADGRIFVAGLLFSDSAAGDTRAADWLFAQTEVVVRGGTVRWHDGLRQAPPLALHQVDVLLRNRHWRHRLQVQASPAPEWGERFALVGQFRQPLLSTRSGHWQQWSGQAFAHFDRIDVQRLRLYTDLGKTVASGRGAVRAWLDIERGRAVGGTADVALADVQATLGERLEPLVLPSVQGRLGGRALAGGFEFHTQALAFVTDDGLRWPGGNVRLKYSDGAGRPGQAQGELNADHMDLAALARIAQRLPLGDKLHQALQSYAPKGLVQSLQASWQGPPEALRRYQARARVAGLELGAVSAPLPGAPGPGNGALQVASPGLRGATIELEMTQAGGKASVAIDSGALLLPGIFEDPWLPLERLRSAVRWQLQGQQVAVQVGETQFANSDAEGTLRATWHTSDADSAPGRARFPGVLDLSGKLVRADGTRVHRYLPLVIAAEARHYVRDAVLAGKATGVDFKVQGDLHDLPFTDPRQGTFRIAAQVRDVAYGYVPPSLQVKGEPPWPALKNLAGELVFEGASMRVQGARGTLEGARAVQLSQVQAHIADLAHAVVAVDAEARGPLSELLGVVKASPLSAWTGHALDQAVASGPAALKLQLQLPLSHLHQSQVRGSVTLAGNGVRMAPDTPALARASGTVEFTETGFALKNARARTLGGEVLLEGGMQSLAAQASPAESALQLRARGVASAQALAQAPELGMLAQLARRASGSAPYTLLMTLRRGVPELLVTSTLEGLALDLPHPLAKKAEAVQPVRFERSLTAASLRPGTPDGSAAPLHDQIALKWGQVGAITYVRDLGGLQPRVLRGSLAAGLAPGEVAPMPAQGVAANLQLDHADVDAWQAVLTDAAPAGAEADTNADADAGAGASAGTQADASALGAAAEAPALAVHGYLPTTVALRANTLKLQDRTLHQVVVGGAREGSVWRATVGARELAGYLEYRQAGAQQLPGGRIFARLSRLSVPADAPDAPGAAGPAPAQPAPLPGRWPGALPALDIVVEHLELQGRALGRLQVQATNQPPPPGQPAQPGGQREWRLHTFNMATPEATLTANGRWAVQEPGPGAAQRHTELELRLDVRDAGLLLQRFGMAGVVRRGKGVLQGQLHWQGVPFVPDYATMGGVLQMDLASGQFLKAEPGLARLLSVLSLQSLPRRLTLDFRDVFSEGFAFDFVRGEVRMKQGVALSNNLQMKGVNAAVLMEGQADLVGETQQLYVLVVPEINAMTASLVATAINPVVGLGSFLAQAFLRGPLMAAATQEFRIDGTWADPQVTRLPRRSRPQAPPAAPTGSLPSVQMAEPARPAATLP